MTDKIDDITNTHLLIPCKGKVVTEVITLIEQRLKVKYAHHVSRFYSVKYMAY
jgi:hypothetical protein